jgi:enoyl-CoA hydratase/carnithine racemase
MLSDLHTVFDELQHPTSMLDALQADFPRVVILSGAGRAFCGGVDIKVDRAVLCCAVLRCAMLRCALLACGAHLTVCCYAVMCCAII